ncbi:hypothetical protein [Limisalsivibrio acetivorans]|uniref:hypothetical protein n=1 Tax=Limisalsivibrio acetivorans TaxID=1304888 RepID=UPI0003B510AF|nr:hypothetical protein [Limisalsivibrio acetivorans]
MTPENNRNDEIDILQVFSALGKYIKPIIASVGAAILLCLAAFSYIYLTKTVTSSYTDFRLESEKFNQNLYPDGVTKFDTTDITSADILREVYTLNSLDEYITFETFRSAVYVEPRMPIEKKRRLIELQQVLVDRKATFEQKEEAQKTMQFLVDNSGILDLRLLYMNPKNPMKAMPDELKDKFLHDILDRWAQKAKENGYLEYPVNIFSDDIVIEKDLIDKEEYVIAVDMLRSTYNVVLENIKEIIDLPSGKKISSPESGLTLPEIRIKLENALNFRLNPLLKYITSLGLNKNPEFIRLYLEEQAFQAKIEYEAVMDRAESYEKAVERYENEQRGGVQPQAGAGENGFPAMIPQLDQSFIDNIINLATTDKKLQYKKELLDKAVEERLDSISYEKSIKIYENILEGLEEDNRGGEDIDLMIRERFDEMRVLLMESISEIRVLYNEIVNKNVNASKELYFIETDMRNDTAHGVNPKKFVVFSGVFVILVAAAAFLIAIVMHYLSKRNNGSKGS